MKKSENKKTSTSWQLFSVIIILLVYLMGATGSLQAQTATKLQVLMPGMTAAPGTSIWLYRNTVYPNPRSTLPGNCECDG